METESSTQPRFLDYVRPLKKRWWLIVIAAVVATGGVYAYYKSKPNQYTTSTLVFYQDPGDPVTGLPSPQSTDRTIENEAQLLSSRANAAAVAKQIGFKGTPQDLLNTVSISSKTGEDFVQITAQFGNANEAATIANAFARQFTSSLNNAYVSKIAGLLGLTKTQLAQTPGGAASDVQRASLLSQIYRLQLADKYPTQVAQQVDPALAPSSPSYPKPLRNALFALALSIVFAIALVYGLERFDRRLRNHEEMERAYGSPLMGVLPHTAEPAPTQNGEPTLGHDFREPFRVLRTNIQLASIDQPPRTIVVSSAMPGEGKSTVVRNLALALRESGKRVVVVDLDLRHPALAKLFGASQGPGITDVLRHDAELDDVTLQIGVGVRLDELVRAAIKVGSPTKVRTNGRGEGLAHPEVALLLGGALPSNPPAVLASERLVEVLDELRARYDIVLIDSAPVLPVTDTVPLLRYADAALFVGRLDVTTRDTAKQLVDFLARVPGVNLLGFVANDLSRFEFGGYGYGYGYGYGPPGRDAPKKRRGRREPAANAPDRPVSEPAKQPVAEPAKPKANRTTVSRSPERTVSDASPPEPTVARESPKQPTSESSKKPDSKSPKKPATDSPKRPDSKSPKQPDPKSPKQPTPESLKELASESLEQPDAESPAQLASDSPRQTA